MINPQKQADLDQAIATVSENFPILWSSIYRGLQQQGFTENQAFELLKVYVMASCKSL